MINNGDIVTYAHRNTHSSGEPTAYGGITGVVSNLGEDNSFSIVGQNCILAVPMRDAWKRRLKGVWLTINGNDVFLPSKETSYEKKVKIENSLLNKFLRLLKPFLPTTV